MNINTYLNIKLAAFSELPIRDTVDKEVIEGDGLGEALKKRIEDFKKDEEAERKRKLYTALAKLYNDNIR